MALTIWMSKILLMLIGMIDYVGINLYYICKFSYCHKINIKKTKIRKLYNCNFIHEKTCN